MPITDAQYAAALARGEQARQLADGVPRRRALRLRAEHPENATEWVALIPGLDFKSRYVALVEVDHGGHFVILNISSGLLLPGLFHLDRFVAIAEYAA